MLSSAPNPSGEYIVKGGYLLTLDPRLGDLARGDVHVRDGAIVAIGEDISSPDIQTLDAAGCIVMPGFVETHWHHWECCLRGHLRADDPENGYFPLTARMCSCYQPADSANAVRLAAAEGLLSGITTLHNWSQNVRDPEFAWAELEALNDMGVRARFSYGVARDYSPQELTPFQPIAQMLEKVARLSRITVGVGLRTPMIAAGSGFSIDLLEREIRESRRLGLPIVMHVGGKGIVGALSARGLLGRDFLLVHPQNMTAEELQSVADTGTPFSIAPVIETTYSALRNGPIQYHELETLGVPMGLSIDSSAASASADFFGVMRALLGSSWRQAAAPVRLAPKKLIELATIDGAKILGLDHLIGSLTPGKRADFIMIRHDEPNVAPMIDPYYSLVFSAQPRNVTLVAVDGDILVRDGSLQRHSGATLAAAVAGSALNIGNRSKSAAASLS